jgi:hypothetical protein
MTQNDINDITQSSNEESALKQMSLNNIKFEKSMLEKRIREIEQRKQTLRNTVVHQCINSFAYQKLSVEEMHDYFSFVDRFNAYFYVSTKLDPAPTHKALYSSLTFAQKENFSIMMLKHRITVPIQDYTSSQKASIIDYFTKDNVATPQAKIDSSIFPTTPQGRSAPYIRSPKKEKEHRKREDLYRAARIDRKKAQNTRNLTEEFKALPQMNMFRMLDDETQVSIGDAADSFTKVMDSLNVTEFNKLLENVNSSDILDKEKVKTLMTQFNHMVISKDKIESTLMATSAGISLTLDLLAVLLSIYGLSNYYNDTSNTNMLILGLTACAYLTYYHGYDLISKLQTLIRPGDETVPQANILHDCSTAIAAILASWTTFTSGRPIPTELFKNFGNLGKVTSTFDSILSLVIRAAEAAVNWVRKTLLGEDTHVRLFAHGNAYVETILQKSEEIEALIRSNKFINNTENHTRLVTIIALIDDTLRTMPRTTETSNLCVELYNMRSRYQKMCDFTVETGSLKSNIRQEPVLVIFTGKPGTKKTIISNLLANELSYALADDVAKANMRDNASLNVYSRRCGEKFWEGYTNEHTVTMIDDLFQKTDVAQGETSDYLDIIHMVNTAPYPLNMANVLSKGKHYFNSKVVIATTNAHKLYPVSIIAPDAVTRRISFFVEILPLAKYAKDGVFDDQLLDTVTINGKETTTIDPHFAEYVEVDVTGNRLSAPMTYDVLKQRILQEVDKKHLYYQVLKMQFNETHNLIDERLKKQQRIDNLQEKADISMIPVPQGDIRDTLRPTHRLSQGLECYRPSPESLKVAEELICELPMKSDGVPGMKILALENMWRFHYGVSVASTLKKVAILLDFYGVDFYDAMMEERPEILNVFFEEIRAGFVVASIPNAPDPGIFSRTKDNYSSIVKLARTALDSATIGLCKVIEFLKTNPIMPIISLLIGAGILAYLIGKAYGLLSSMISALFSVDLPATPESMGKQPSGVKVERNLSKMKDAVARPHLGKDVNGVKTVESIVKSNSYEVFYDRPNGLTSIGFATVIVANIMIIPYHYITHLYAEVTDDPTALQRKIELRPHDQKQSSYFYKVSDLIEGSVDSKLVTNDLILVYMPRTFRRHRNIIKYFLTDANVLSIPDNADVMIAFPKSTTYATAFTVGKRISNKMVSDIDGSTYQILTAFQYSNVATVAGDCGALITYQNTAIQTAKIFAIHTAGVTAKNLSFGSIVTQEALNEALVIQGFDEVETLEMPVAQCAIFNSGHMMEIKRVERSPRIPSQTKLTKSELYGKWDDLFTPCEAPAPIDRLFKDGNLKKIYDKYHVHTIQEHDFTRELEEEMNWMKNVSTNYADRRIYTYKEAVTGITGTKFYSLDRSTSSGYPYNLDVRSSKKTYFWGNSQEFCLSNPRALKIEQETMHYIECCEKGIRLPQIYSDFPKDQLENILKIALGKIRLVSGCTTAFLIACRMYFGAFMFWITSNNVINGCCAGTDPVSSDWDILAKRLIAFNRKNAEAGDYKCYDGSLPPDLLWAVLDFINTWYDDEFASIRAVMWLEIVFSRHIMDFVVFEWLGSMPSGNPLTLIINTIANKIAFRWCWNQMISTSAFSDNVFLVVQGDDNLFSVSETYASMFNVYAIAPVIANLGLTLTPEDKGSLEVFKPRLLTEVEFMKRSFVFNPDTNTYLGPLRLQKVLEMPYWTAKNDDNITKDKTKVALQELALRGREAFNLYGKRMLVEFEQAYQHRNGWFEKTSYTQVLGLPFER